MSLLPHIMALASMIKLSQFQIGNILFMLPVIFFVIMSIVVLTRIFKHRKRGSSGDDDFDFGDSDDSDDSDGGFDFDFDFDSDSDSDDSSDSDD